MHILGIRIDTVTFDKALEVIKSYLKEPRFHLVTTVNAEFILTAQEDAEFRKILNSAALSLPDGSGVVWALQLGKTDNRAQKGGTKAESGSEKSVFTFLPSLLPSVISPPTSYERIAGADLVPALIQLAAENGYTVGLLGGESWHGQNVCDLVKMTLQRQYPRLTIVYCSREPSNTVFTTPIDLLFVAFGHPKQEKWLWQNRDRLSHVRVGMGVGGTFDFICGKKRRAPVWLRRLGLEGLWRLVIEPSRWRRVLNAYLVFPLSVILSPWRRI